MASAKTGKSAVLTLPAGKSITSRDRPPIRVGSMRRNPTGGLRRIEPTRIGGRSLEVIDFPAGKVRTADFPVFALAIRRQDECPFSCTYQGLYLTHA